MRSHDRTTTSRREAREARRPFLALAHLTDPETEEKIAHMSPTAQPVYEPYCKYAKCGPCHDRHKAYRVMHLGAVAAHRSQRVPVPIASLQNPAAPIHLSALVPYSNYVQCDSHHGVQS